MVHMKCDAKKTINSIKGVSSNKKYFPLFNKKWPPLAASRKASFSYHGALWQEYRRNDAENNANFRCWFRKTLHKKQKWNTDMKHFELDVNNRIYTNRKGGGGRAYSDLRLHSLPWVSMRNSATVSLCEDFDLNLVDVVAWHGMTCAIGILGSPLPTRIEPDPFK